MYGHMGIFIKAILGGGGKGGLTRVWAKIFGVSKIKYYRDLKSENLKIFLYHKIQLYFLILAGFTQNVTPFRAGKYQRSGH